MDAAKSEAIRIRQLDNGLVLLAEPMDWLESAAFCLLLPAGCIYDPASRLGLSNFACEMVQRGCGTRDSRAFIEDLDGMGVQRSCGVSAAHTSFGAALPREKLIPTLSVYADLVRRPHLPTAQLEDGRQVCLQELYAAQDDLPQRTMQRLKEALYPNPWCRATHGELPAVQATTGDDIRQFVESHYQPRGAILAIAGRYEWDELNAAVDQLFGDWQPLTFDVPAGVERSGKWQHIEHDSLQTQIGVGFEGVPYAHSDYYQARCAVGVLSDGMSARLFTEVREKRGLAYTVYAACHSLRHMGSVMCYAGTSTGLAQQTLNVLVGELQRLQLGVEPDELRRLKARIKSGLVMQQESSPSRAASIAGDWYHLQNVRSLPEVKRRIDALTCDSINAYLAANPPRDFAVVTLGDHPLEMPDGVSSSRS